MVSSRMSGCMSVCIPVSVANYVLATVVSICGHFESCIRRGVFECTLFLENAQYIN